MADGREKDSELLSGENWLTDWENQVMDEWQDSDVEERAQHESELTAQKLWLSFQNSASSITQLYRDRCENSEALWVPFQNSASRVTILYKDSLDAMRRGIELGKQLGHQRRTRDVLGWLRKKRRHVRREELVAYLCGKSPPPPPVPPRGRGAAVWGKSGPGAGHYHRPHHRGSASHPGSPRLLPRPPPSSATAPCDDPAEPDLGPFRDALALHRLNGAMSNISMGFSGSHLNNNNNTASSNNNTATSVAMDAASSAGNGRLDDDFHCFVLEEMTRRCDRKRAGSNSPHGEGRVDSPSRKRSRLL